MTMYAYNSHKIRNKRRKLSHSKNQDIDKKLNKNNHKDHNVLTISDHFLSVFYKVYFD
ncbi:hypothetical protein TUMSATVNIG3_51890 [Vibrio nigripulchritudo]|nr:hypothetical protein TUMSATVNIG2_51230 [Vibrio nigripulchritudo]BDU46391.1 hypothetical protein TUMSATVNIG3_51890 [Vibrio nigripulchritudo]